MTLKNYIEECKRKFGQVMFRLPIDEIGTNKVEGGAFTERAIKFAEKFTFSDLKQTALNRMVAANPIMANVADILPWIFWDTLNVNAGASIGTSFDFFVTPIGQGGKTKVQTNMEQVQRLPDPLWANVYSLGFEFGPQVVLADIVTLVNNYYHEFWVGNKTYAEGLYQMFPAGTGFSGVSTQNNVGVFNNGRAQLSNTVDLRLPAGLNLGSLPEGNVVSDGLTGVTILQGQQFKVRNQAPGGAQNASAAGGGLQLRCNLYTILSRGVQ